MEFGFLLWRVQRKDEFLRGAGLMTRLPDMSLYSSALAAAFSTPLLLVFHWSCHLWWTAPSKQRLRWDGSHNTGLGRRGYWLSLHRQRTTGLVNLSCVRSNKHGQLLPHPRGIIALLLGCLTRGGTHCLGGYQTIVRLYL